MLNNNFKFYLDGEEIHYVRQGFVINETLSEDIGTCDIIYKSTSKELAIPYESTFKIVDEVENKEYNYVVANDEVVIVCQKPPIYQHTLLLVNGKKYYSRISVPAFTITHTANEEFDTYLALLALRMNYPLETEDNFEATRLFNIPESWATNSRFREKSPQLFLTNTTLVEVLDRIFKNVDYYCKIDTPYTENNIPTLSYVDPNKRNYLIQNASKKFNESYETDAQNHVQTLQSNIVNAVVEEDNPQAKVYYPGRNMWARTKIANSFRNVRDGSNVYFITDRPIIKLEKLNILCRLTAQFYDHNVIINGGEPIIINLAVDISNFVYLKDQYDTLSQRSLWDRIWKIPREDYKDYAMYYEYKGNVIFGGNNVNGGNNVVDDAVNNNIKNLDYVIYNGIKWYNRAIYGETKDYSYGYGTHTIINQNNGTSEQQMLDFHYNIEYITENNVIVNQKRIDNESFKLESYLTINQAENVPNTNQLGRNMFGIINRIGLNQAKWQNRVKRLMDCNNLGDYTSDNYVVTQKSTTNYNDYTEYMLILQKNFNIISQNVAIDEEFRPFDVPRKGILNEVHYDEYLIFSSINPNKGSNSFLKKLDWLSAFSNDEIVNYKPETVLFFSYNNTPTGDEGNTPVYVSLQAFSIGNSICFNFKFDDNILAGNKLSKIDDENEYAVKYTADDGTFGKFSFAMINDIEILYGTEKDNFNGQPAESNTQAIANEDYNYPEISQTVLNRFNSSDNILIQSPKFQYYKDASSIFAMTYQIHFVPSQNDVRNIIIGEKLTAMNPLIIDGEYVKKLYVYTGITRLSPLNNKKCTGTIDNDNKVIFDSVNGTIKTQNNNQFFELGDEEGNLYLQVNGTNTVYLRSRNKRDF